MTNIPAMLAAVIQRHKVNAIINRVFPAMDLAKRFICFFLSPFYTLARI